LTEGLFLFPNSRKQQSYKKSQHNVPVLQKRPR
jgi:hypothetical protein